MDNNDLNPIALGMKLILGIATFFGVVLIIGWWIAYNTTIVGENTFKAEVHAFGKQHIPADITKRALTYEGGGSMFVVIPGIEYKPVLNFPAYRNRTMFMFTPPGAKRGCGMPQAPGSLSTFPTYLLRSLHFEVGMLGGPLGHTLISDARSHKLRYILWSSIPNDTLQMDMIRKANDLDATLYLASMSIQSLACYYPKLRRIGIPDLPVIFIARKSIIVPQPEDPELFIEYREQDMDLSVYSMEDYKLGYDDPITYSPELTVGITLKADAKDQDGWNFEFHRGDLAFNQATLLYGAKKQALAALNYLLTEDFWIKEAHRAGYYNDSVTGERYAAALNAASQLCQQTKF